MGVVVGDDVARSPSAPPAAPQQLGVAEAPVGHAAVDGVVLRRVVEAGLVRKDDRQQAIPVGVALVLEPLEVGGQRRAAPRRRSPARRPRMPRRRSPTPTAAAAGRSSGLRGPRASGASRRAAPGASPARGPRRPCAAAGRQRARRGARFAARRGRAPDRTTARRPRGSTSPSATCGGSAGAPGTCRRTARHRSAARPSRQFALSVLLGEGAEGGRGAASAQPTGARHARRVPRRIPSDQRRQLGVLPASRAARHVLASRQGGGPWWSGLLASARAIARSSPGTSPSR